MAEKRRKIRKKKTDNLVKIVTPVKAGVQVSYKFLKILDSGFRRNDKKQGFLTFYEAVKI